MPGLLDFIGGLSRGAVAGTLGGPVDMATLALNSIIAGGGYAGHKLGLLETPPALIEKPFGGSESIAQGMRNIGLLNDNPGSTGDRWGDVAGNLLPILTAAKAPQIAGGLLRGVDNMMAPRMLSKEAGAITLDTEPMLRGMTREQFLGKPRIVGKSDAVDLRPTQLKSLEEANAVPFMDGKYQAKYSPSGAVVLDGDTPIASYNFGDTLTVAKPYRKQGIGSELVYQQRTYHPEPAHASTRNKVSQGIQEGVWERIQQDLASMPERQPFIYPQDKALATAQANAALPAERGGLGLLEGNTPMERARAMGFTDDAFHGTPNDGIVRSRQFKDEKLGKSTRVSDAEKGHFTADRGEAASEYIWSNGGTDGGNVLPLLLGGNRAKTTLPGEWAPNKYDAAIDAAKAGGFDGLDIAGTTTLGKPGNYQVSFDPKNIRSRFAAFDPARRNEADLLGQADPALLALIAAGGYGGYNAMKD